MRSSLTYLKQMMTKNRLSWTTSMAPLPNLHHCMTPEVLKKVLPMLTMQMALQMKLQMNWLSNVHKMPLKILPLSVPERSQQMTLLLNVQRISQQLPPNMLSRL